VITVRVARKIQQTRKRAKFQKFKTRPRQKAEKESRRFSFRLLLFQNAEIVADE
jgi:hypothetical protein